MADDVRRPGRRLLGSSPELGSGRGSSPDLSRHSERVRLHPERRAFLPLAERVALLEREAYEDHGDLVSLQGDVVAHYALFYAIEPKLEAQGKKLESLVDEVGHRADPRKKIEGHGLVAGIDRIERELAEQKREAQAYREKREGAEREERERRAAIEAAVRTAEEQAHRRRVLVAKIFLGVVAAGSGFAAIGKLILELAR